MRLTIPATTVTASLLPSRRSPTCEVDGSVSLTANSAPEPPHFDNVSPADSAVAPLSDCLRGSKPIRGGVDGRRRLAIDSGVRY